MKINKKPLTFLTKRRKKLLFGRAALVERPGLWGGARGGLGNEAQRAIRAVADEKEMDEIDGRVRSVGREEQKQIRTRQ